MKKIYFQTIKQKNTDKPEIYHGFILKRSGSWFKFVYRVNRKNIIIEGFTDYWDIII
jgi:hypothetical protein